MLESECPPSTNATRFGLAAAGEDACAAFTAGLAGRAGSDALDLRSFVRLTRFSGAAAPVLFAEGVIGTSTFGSAAGFRILMCASSEGGLAFDFAPRLPHSDAPRPLGLRRAASLCARRVESPLLHEAPQHETRRHESQDAT